PALGLSQGPLADVGGTGAVGTLWPSSGVPLSPLLFAASGAPAGHSRERFFASEAAASPLRNVSFDVSTGHLASRAPGGEHPVHTGVAADGLVDVTLDGQRHSTT